jgi:hypothetical protein
MRETVVTETPLAAAISTIVVLPSLDAHCRPPSAPCRESAADRA